MIKMWNHDLENVAYNMKDLDSSWSKRNTQIVNCSNSYVFWTTGFLDFAHCLIFWKLENSVLETGFVFIPMWGVEILTPVGHLERVNMTCTVQWLMLPSQGITYFNPRICSRLVSCFFSLSPIRFANSLHLSSVILQSELIISLTLCSSLATVNLLSSHSLLMLRHTWCIGIVITFCGCRPIC